MDELVQVSKHCYYVDGPAKVGIVDLGYDEVCLIDSGVGRDAGPRLTQIIEANHWWLGAIYNTHSHHDHIAGDGYLQDLWDCKVYAPGIECVFTRTPGIEPGFLYGGFAPQALVKAYRVPSACDCEPLTLDVLPDCLEAIDLPGHYLQMVGFRGPEDVVYLADCLVGEATLAHGDSFFVYDVAAYLDTLERVRSMEASIFVPAHTPATTDIGPLVDANAAAIHRNADFICDVCSEPRTVDEVIQRVFRRYGLRMSLKQYVIVGSTTRSYLAYLSDQGRVEPMVDADRLLWKQV